MSARPCKACGITIEFIEGPSGKVIPVQKIRTVYLRNRISDAAPLVKMDKIGENEMGGEFEVDYYVSHFETCSDPGRFSR